MLEDLAAAVGPPAHSGRARTMNMVAKRSGCTWQTAEASTVHNLDNT